VVFLTVVDHFLILWRGEGVFSYLILPLFHVDLILRPFQLEGLRQRAEGLCHISQIRNERVNAVADVLSRGQRVKVKVRTFVFVSRVVAFADGF